MSTTQTPNESAAKQSTAVQTRLEVAILPVSDVDRAKAFYAGLGWRLDADFPIDEGFRVLQLTPPGSPASVIFGTGVSTAGKGSTAELMMVVDDVEAARQDLISRGADVSEVWHGRGFGTDGREPGHDPENGSYSSFASFNDPDGNRWLLQEIHERLPGRVWGDVEELAELLHETSGRHGEFEAVAPEHNWWDWYAAYMDARRRGSSPEESSATANTYMADVKGVVV